MKSFYIHTKTREYSLPLITVILTTLLFIVAYFFHKPFLHFFDVSKYLTWHTIFELIEALVSFSVFMLAYYTYEQNKNLRLIFLGSLFLCTGMVSIFHSLSYKGMPQFFVENFTANPATTYWILNSLISGVGLLAATFMPHVLNRSYNRFLFVIIPLSIATLVFYIVTYHPGLLPAMYIEGKGLTPIKIILEYIIMILNGAAAFKLLHEYTVSRRSYHLLVLATAILIKVSARVAFTFYGSVYDIYNYIGHIFCFLSSFMVFRALFIIGVQKPYYELETAQQELRNYAENLDRLVIERTEELNSINQQLMDDLEYARDIQKATLPSSLPENSNLGLAAGYFPAERVSGDFYNLVKLDDDNVALYIGDVSGHGVPAAILSVFANQTIKLLLESDEKELPLRPELVLKGLLEAYNRANFRDEVYLVLLYSVYNIPTRKLTYSSAGMNAEPYKIGKDGSVEKIWIEGFPICKLLNYYPIEYTSTQLQLKQGEKVIFLTDGLIETTGCTGVEYTEKWLVNMLNDSGALSAGELADKISDNLSSNTLPEKLKDDITFFILEAR